MLKGCNAMSLLSKTGVRLRVKGKTLPANTGEITIICEIQSFEVSISNTEFVLVML